MNYQASIHHLVTGRFLLNCSIQAHDLHEAETVAIERAALRARAHPRDMDVRHLHQCMERRTQNVTDHEYFSA